MLGYKNISLGPGVPFTISFIFFENLKQFFFSIRLNNVKKGKLYVSIKLRVFSLESQESVIIKLTLSKGHFLETLTGIKATS